MKPRTSNTAACRIRWSACEGICWETKRAYAFPVAMRLAAMFEANSRNRGATVHQRTKTTWVIRIYPNSLAGIYQRVMRAMQDRLRIEGDGYQFARRADGTYDCHNPKSGQTYIVSQNGCTCPQAQRAAMIGAACKHVTELNRRLTSLPLAGDFEVAA